MREQLRAELNADHARFAATDFGQKLAANVRFDYFRPDHRPNAEWVGYLGHDVNNLDHMPVTTGLMGWLLEHSNGTFSEEESELILTAAMIHDRGEAVVGDIMEPLKTDRDAGMEKTALLQMIDQWEAQDAGQSTLYDRYRKAVTTVIFPDQPDDPTNRLHQVFSLFERVGYLRVAFIAWGRFQAPDCPEEYRTAFRTLATEVVGRSLPKVQPFADTYPGIRAFLDHPVHAERIREITGFCAGQK